MSQRWRFWFLPVSLLGFAFYARPAAGHHSDPGAWFQPVAVEASVVATTPAPGITGQGKYRFRVFLKSDALPQAARDVLVKAHGGFAVDERAGKGETYWALPGAGVLQVAPNLKSVALLKTTSVVKEAALHNTTIWYAKGKPMLVFPGVEAAKIFTTNIEGTLLHTLDAPTGNEFGIPIVNDYFRGAGNFVPTDVEHIDGIYYITTGYSNLDYVLTARVTSTSPFKAQWHDLAFGGRGNGPGQFGTGHGITVRPGTKIIEIADRPNAEIDRFTRHGQHLGTQKIPAGSLPCDTFFLDQYMLVPALDGPNRKEGAPIYLYENGELVSTILAKRDLGLENFQHIHNAVLRRVEGKLYVIAQAWNPGDFAVFEQINN